MRALTSLGKAQLASLVVLGLTAAVAVGFAADNATNSNPRARQSVTSLTQRNATAGPVKIKVTPVRLNATGAAFKIVLDNHERELTMNLANGASLSVGSLGWGPATWSGDGPSGHHREGQLSFPPGGAATGQVVLNLTGFPAPIQLTWTLPEGGVRS